MTTEQVGDRSFSTVGDGDEHEPVDFGDIDTVWSSSEETDESESSDKEEKRDSSTQPPFLPKDFSEPLYDGANISVCATYCAIMEFSISARLPYSSIEKLLSLLELLCPPDSKLPPSMYKLKQFFQSFSTDYEKTEICSGCGQELPADHTYPQGMKNNVVVHLPIQNSLQALTQSKRRGRERVGG